MPVHYADNYEELTGESRDDSEQPENKSVKPETVKSKVVKPENVEDK